jgi:hypothetical protein
VTIPEGSTLTAHIIHPDGTVVSGRTLTIPEGSKMTALLNHPDGTNEPVHPGAPAHPAPEPAHPAAPKKLNLVHHTGNDLLIDGTGDGVTVHVPKGAEVVHQTEHETVLKHGEHYQYVNKDGVHEVHPTQPPKGGKGSSSKGGKGSNSKGGKGSSPRGGKGSSSKGGKGSSPNNNKGPKNVRPGNSGASRTKAIVDPNTHPDVNGKVLRVGTNGQVEELTEGAVKKTRIGSILELAGKRI